MTATADRRLPLMWSVFGLHPWDIDRLTRNQLAQYHAALDALTDEEATHG